MHEQFKNDIAAIPSKHDLKIKIDAICLPKNDESGTADSLRCIKDKIKVIYITESRKEVIQFETINMKTDVLVVSCDLVCDTPLHNLFDLHRTHQSSVTTLFSEIPQEVVSTSVPGPKTKFKQGISLVQNYKSIIKL